ncbi:MAG: MlaD family protein [Candidatus Marinimicrobia bacterium]|nr:MlaD family protein [Candidatus Neomarinimicrobiota bacterium]
MKRSRMQDMTMEVTVGAFLFMVLLALGFFTIILSRDNFLRKTYPVRVFFTNVMGLREGDNVFVRGVVVGRIGALEVQDDGVTIHANLTRPLKLYEDYKAEILPTSVLGGRYLSLEEGSPPAPPISEEIVLVGRQPIDLIDEASATIRMVRDALGDGGVLENLKVAMANVREVTEKVNQGDGTLARLLNDDGLYQEVQGIATDLRAISGRLAAGEGTLGKLLSEDDTLYNDMSETVASLKRLVGNVAAGQGTIGKLLSEDDIYHQFQQVLNDARGAIDDFRETAPITTFSSVFFGAF